MDQRRLITDGVHQVSAKRSAIIKRTWTMLLSNQKDFFKRNLKITFLGTGKVKTEIFRGNKEIIQRSGKRNFKKTKEAIDEGISIVWRDCTIDPPEGN